MFGKSLSAIEADEKQAAMNRYVELIHLSMSLDPEQRKSAETPAALAEMRQLAGKLGKSAADVSRDESIISQFNGSKDLSRGYEDAGDAQQKAMRDVTTAQAKFEQEVAAAKARLTAVEKKQEDAAGVLHQAQLAQARCKQLIQGSPELFRPEDKEYPRVQTTDMSGKHTTLYQRSSPLAEAAK